jgi:hypothetical protein
MKVPFIHKTLGIKMWVTESEVEIFKAAGHKLVASSEPAIKDAEVVEEPKEAKEEVKPEVKRPRKASRKK